MPSSPESSLPPSWLAWAREIQALAQTGLTFAAGPYDIQRYRRLTEIAAEMVGACSGAELAPLVENFLAQPGYATPKVDVRGAVVRDGKILLVHEKADGRWCMPGGWADIDEAPSAMVAREILEESGIVATPKKVVGVFDANKSGFPREFFHAYKVVFLCDYVSGDPRPSDETLAARYFPFADLPPLSENRTHPRHLEEVEKHLMDPSRSAWFD